MNENLITIAEYAEKHEVQPNAIRKGCIAGKYKTAKKIGRDWLISAEEEKIDMREKNRADCYYIAREAFAYVNNLQKKIDIEIDFSEYHLCFLCGYIARMIIANSKKIPYGQRSRKNAYIINSSSVKLLRERTVNLIKNTLETESDTIDSMKQYYRQIMAVICGCKIEKEMRMTEVKKECVVYGNVIVITEDNIDEIIEETNKQFKEK